MAQHISQSKRYRDIGLSHFMDMSEEQAWETFVKCRWGSMTSMPCPTCGVIDEHYRRRTRRQWCCKHCSRVFSVTSDTPFMGRRLSFKRLLLLIFLFAIEPKGLSANKLSGQIGVTFRTAFQNLGKLREAIFQTQDLTPLSGIVQIDGGHFCGKPRRPRRRTKMTSEIANNILRNRKASIVPPKRGGQIEPWNREKLKNRRIVIVMREVMVTGRIIVAIAKAEDQKSVVPLVQKRVCPGSVIQTDDGKAYTPLSAWFDHQTVRHSVEYCTDDGVNNNQAESFFSRMRRAEYGVHHGMRPQYLAFYAAEFAWREMHRAESLGTKFFGLLKRILSCDISRAWRGYAQGRRLGFEYLG
jgi:transposase-like protein